MKVRGPHRSGVLTLLLSSCVALLGCSGDENGSATDAAQRVDAPLLQDRGVFDRGVFDRGVSDRRDGSIHSGDRSTPDVWAADTAQPVADRDLPDAAPEPGYTPRWELRRGASGIALEARHGATLTREAEGVSVQGAATDPPAFAIGGLAIAAQPAQFAVLRMQANTGEYGGIVFDTDPPLAFTFPIRADGQMHTYNVWLGPYYLVPRYREHVTAARDPVLVPGAFPGSNTRKMALQTSRFRGDIGSFEVRPTYAAGAEAKVAWVSLDDRPQGRPLLVIEHVGPAEAVVRAGRAAVWGIRVRNAGGVPATGLTLSFPRGTGLEPSPDSVRNIPTFIPPDEVRTLYFDATASAPDVSATLDVTVSCAEGDSATRTGRARTRALPPSLAAGEVPRPNPIRTGYDIGAWYFPGWTDLRHWPSNVSWFERRPALGYYDERSPVASDWDIKWAVEHGINYFLVECIWDASRHCESYLAGLLASRFISQIQFAIAYVNHDGTVPAGTPAQQEERFYEMISTWIARYLRHPQYKRTAGGKLYLPIFSGSSFFEAMGRDAARMRRALAHADELVRAAGLPGIAWSAGSVAGTTQGETYRGYGFTGTQAYNWASATAPYPVRDAAYWTSWGENRLWNNLFSSGLTVNLPVATGFNHKPWRGGRTPDWVVTGFDEGVFEAHLRRAKAFLDARRTKAILLGAWNEWGEGSCVGPSAETGFGFLDAVRRVFAPAAPARPVVIPSDVGVYPPEIPHLWDWTRFTPGLRPPNAGSPPAGLDAAKDGIDIPPGSYPGQRSE